MKHREKSVIDLKLSVSDFEAILCALPLVASYQADTPLQTQINADLAASVEYKFENGIEKLSSNEIRVISAAVSLALFMLSSEYDPCAPIISPEYRAELSRYFFHYNRLDPILEEACDKFLNAQSH